MNKTKTLWYKETVSFVLGAQDVTKDGLSNDDAKQRLQECGPNTITSKGALSPLKILVSQLKDTLILILVAAATVSMLLSLYEGHGVGTESLLIYGIIVAIVIVGFFNEYKAEKTVESLKGLLAFHARVRRNGKVVEIDATELVPGDIILIEEGQKAPADIRLFAAEELRVNEASLTGESSTVSKTAIEIDKTVALADMKNMLFSGTFVVSGTAEGVVVATANHTELGKIASLVEGVEDEVTPMQRKLDDLGKKLAWIVLILCVVVFAAVFAFADDKSTTLAQRLIFAFTAAVALAVAAIPEGLAFVVRISLALGARRMAKKNALVRKLSAVEALGSTDVICSDKTGTLTKGEMTVRGLWVDGTEYQMTGEGYHPEGELQSMDGKSLKQNGSVEQLLTLGALCNNANIKESTIIGDPTEGSLHISAAKVGLHYKSLHEKLPRVKELPFNSERKMMATVHQQGSDYFVAAKGAPDVILAKSSKIMVDGSVVPLTEKHRQAILMQNTAFAQKALRVLAFATKELTSEPKNAQNLDQDLVFVGLQAMIDPPRKEVAEVIKRVTTEAGMRVVMITGDHIDTAQAIAQELGIIGEAVSGIDLDAMTQDEFEQRVEDIRVYARVSPEHKIRIVQALKKRGHQVAMTGDGVNDAPAIKAADIGIAMGITGTDVTKEAADLILLDDQFLTIVTAIEEGRGIFDNMRKFVNFLLSVNISEVITILAGIIFFRELLLSPAQILFINIVTDGLPAIALGSDPAAKGVMKFSPKKYQSSIINVRIWAEIVAFGILMTTALLVLYNNVPAIYAGTIVFTGMVVFEMARLIDIRTDYRIRWFSNPLLTVSIVASLLIQIAVVHTPAFAKLLDIHTLQANHWFILVLVSMVLIAVMKLLNRPFNRFGHEHENASA